MVLVILHCSGGFTDYFRIKGIHWDKSGKKSRTRPGRVGDACPVHGRPEKKACSKKNKQKVWI
jgi:hypothetical protein